MSRLPGPVATWTLGLAFVPLAGECAAVAAGGQSGRILWADLWVIAGISVLLARNGFVLDIPRAPFLAALAPLLGWALLTVPLSLDPLTALAEMKEWVIAAAAGALALVWARDARRARALLGAVVLAAVTLAILMARAAAVHPLGPAAAVLLKQVDLPFGRSNYLAGMLVLAMPIALGLFAASRRRRLRIAWFIAFVVLTAGLALSGSKGGILAAGAGCALAFLTPRSGKLPRSPRFVLIAAAALFAVVFAAGPLRAALDYRMQASAIEFSAGERQALYALALDIAARNPVLGTGINCFSVASHGLHGLDTVPHNFELGFLAELGVPGLVLALLWAWAILAPARRACAGATHPRSRALARAVWGSLAAVMLHNQVESTLYGEQFKILLFLVAAAALQIARSQRSHKPGTA